MTARRGDDPGEDERFGPSGSRFAAVSRRAFLARSAGLGAAALVGLSSCGHDDAAVFARGASTDATRAPKAGANDGSTSTSTRPPATSSPTVTEPPASPASTAPPASPSTTAAPSSTTSPPAPSGNMAVRFTYKPTSSGGRVNNPYIASWIEDSGGALVDTLGLWFLQDSKGRRWLNELRRWYSVDGSTADTTTSATRTPGDYALVWDRTDTDGAVVSAGQYFVCIEAAREHGPYSLIRQPFTLGSAAFTTALPAQGELTNASITYPAG